MAPAAVSGGKVNFGATIYDHISDPTAKQLFSCKAARDLRPLEETAAAVLNALTVKFMGISSHEKLDGATRLDRYVYILATDFLSKEGIASKLKNYSYEESGLLSKTWYVLTYPKYMFVSDSNKPDTNCDLPPSKLGREDYVFCQEAKAFFAELKTSEVKTECGLAAPSVVHDKHLQSMGDFILASENEELGLSINSAKARIEWDDNYQPEYCIEHASNEKYCLGELAEYPRNVNDYVESVVPYIGMPAKVRSEVEAAFGKKIESDKTQNVEL